MSAPNQSNQKNQDFFAKISSKIFALIFLFALSSSCTDQGCIDADDFGEYETQTLEVSANDSQGNCSYDPSKGLDEQPEGLKTCPTGSSGCYTLVSGRAFIDDGTTKATSETLGCKGFEATPTLKSICISDVVQRCVNASSISSTSAEPRWTKTDQKVEGKNIGITLKPGAAITIRAVGSVKLGDMFESPPLFVQANTPFPHSKTDVWNNNFFDVRNGQTLDFKFSGQWSDDTGNSNAKIGAGASSDVDAKLFNGARRIVAFLIPHPIGYEFNVTANGEREGSKYIPLLPDRDAWQCSYNDSSTTQSICSTKSYSNLPGYQKNQDNTSVINESLVSTTFPLTSSYKTHTLTKFGGMIRWTGDGLKPDSLPAQAAFDPFFGVYYDDNGTCNGPCTILPEQGQMLAGIASGPLEIPNPDQSGSTAYKVSFKSLIATSQCNVTLDVFISKGDQDLYSVTTNGETSAIKRIAISQSNWSTTHLTLDVGQKLTIKRNNTTYGTKGTFCDKAIAVKFNKYHDLKMETSGFLSFKILDGIGTCRLKGRIMNLGPKSWIADYRTPDFTADAYEYDDFVTKSATESTDPLANLEVRSDSWTRNNAVFVRKGQTIRFSPESWDNTFQGNGSNKECGIGMAMSITPRPALLCKGKTNDIMPNMNCSQEIKNDGTLIGCRAASADCDLEGQSFCPKDCRKRITCTVEGTKENNYKRDCTIGTDREGTCTFPDDKRYTPDTCDSCAGKMYANATTSAKIAVPSMNQCYDLENYEGKVSNIPADGFTEVQLTGAEKFISKGATKLGLFNGSYGNFESFSSTGKTDVTANNKIFQLKTPISFPLSGRLRFFMLDDGDFRGMSLATSDSYSNNSSPNATYTGQNGFKITSSSMLEFSNGQWLQAMLCAETSDTSNACRPMGTTEPTEINPKLVRLEVPSGDKITDPVPTGNYMFDSYGNLRRRTNAEVAAGDCKLATHGIASQMGSNFYCHTEYYRTQEQIKNKKNSSGASISNDEIDGINTNISRLRLTFKILDPEPLSCNSADPTATTGFDGVILKNPFYKPIPNPNFNTTCTTDEYNSGTCQKQFRLSGNETVSNPGYFIPPNTNLGARCTKAEMEAESKCEKELYCGNKYLNNSGKYYVNIKVKSPGSGEASSIISRVIQPVIEVMDGKKDGSTVGQAERMYKLIISDARYKTILNLSLVMMFTLYGFGYLMGMSDANITETWQRIMKIGLIYLFVSETGWKFFNDIVVKFFKDGTDFLAFMMASSFDNSPDIARAIANSDYYDKSILFSSADKVFGMFFSQAVQKKIAALLFASIFGWAYLLIVYNSFMLYVYAVANAVLIYLTAQIFLSILFTLAPIFFLFTLFQTTKGMFDNWLKQLIGFSLQQIFLLTTLSFFNMMMYEVVKMSLGYKICWDEVWTINIYIARVTLLSFWSIASLPPRTNAQSDVGNIGNPDGIPSLFSILFIWVIASLMNKFVGFMSNLAASIAGGVSASSLGGGIKDFATSMKTMASKSELAKKAGQIMSAAGARIDHKLFDHGEQADAARKQAKANNAKNADLKSELSDAGNAAVKKFKTENAKDLIGKSKSEQQKILNEKRMEGMKRKADELQLTPGKLKELQEDKGFKYAGNNVFGAAYQLAKQARKGTLTSSLADKDAKTKFSSGRAKEAMKNMSQEDRKKFIASVAAGQIEVGKSKKAIARDATIAAGRGAKAGIKAAGSAAFSTTKAVVLAPVKAMKGIASGVKAIHESRKAGTLVDDATAYQRKLADKLGNALGKKWDSANEKTARAFSKAGTAIGEKIDKAMEESEYTKAAHQLEDEAAIPRMAGGRLGNAMRSDREKKAIRDRAKANIAKKKISDKAGDIDAVSELERESEYLDRISEIEQSGDPESSLSSAAKSLKKAGAAISRTHSAVSVFRGEKDAKVRAQAKKDVAKGAKERVGEEIGEIDEDLKASEKREEDARQARSDVIESPEYKQTSAALEETNEEVKNLRDEKKKMGRLSRFSQKGRINNEKMLAAEEKKKALEMKLKQQTLPADTAINKEQASRAVLGEKRRSLEKVKESLPDDDTDDGSGDSSGAAGASGTAASAGAGTTPAAAGSSSSLPEEEATEAAEIASESLSGTVEKSAGTAAEAPTAVTTTLNPKVEGVEFVDPDESVAAPAADSKTKMQMHTNPMFKHRPPEPPEEKA